MCVDCAAPALRRMQEAKVSAIQPRSAAAAVAWRAQTCAGGVGGSSCMAREGVEAAGTVCGAPFADSRIPPVNLHCRAGRENRSKRCAGQRGAQDSTARMVAAGVAGM